MSATIATLTTLFAQQRLQEDGLAALGLTAPLCAMRWSTSGQSATYLSSELALALPEPCAPFSGTLEWLASGIEFIDAAGAPVTDPVAVVRLHPQAAQRLERLAAARFTTDGVLVQPVPATFVVRLAEQPDRTPQRVEAGEALGGDIPPSPQVSFHDTRGMIICPVAVAAMLADLLTALPALRHPAAAGSPGDVNGLASLAALASGNHVMLCDLHGALFTPLPGTGMMVQGGGSPGNANAGHITLSPGQQLQASSTSQQRLHWGWAPNGTLDQLPLQLPALPSSYPPPLFSGAGAPNLTRRFFRVFVVDGDWHLLGNRSQEDIRGIPGDDGNTPADLLPPVRNHITLGYLTDGPDILAATRQVVERFMNQATGLVMACSPQFQPTGLPPAPGAQAHWPVFPSMSTATFNVGLPSPVTGLAARWAAANSLDVVVTLAAAATPAGTGIRIYPRLFQEIVTIAAEPSFLRGDGGAALADGTNPTEVLLSNPFGLAEGANQPPDPTLVMDVVLAAANGQRRLFGGLSAPVGAPGAAPAPAALGGLNMLDAVPPNMRGICPVPLFGLKPDAVPPAGSPGSVTELLRKFASETTPRTGPRLPMQARFETIVASAIGPAAQDGALAWQAVCTGARWMDESRSAMHLLGNPGNPPGPDVHTNGIRVDGQLAHDLAWHALRRARPLLPLPGSPGGLDGWLLFGSGDNFNLPPEPAGAGSPTGMGALLQTAAPQSETPELSLAPESLFTDPTPSLQAMADDLASRLGSPAPTLDMRNADRQLAQVRREYWVSRNGRRDALWSLRRVLADARELVYIESAQFARTAQPGQAGAHAIDLVNVLLDSMTEHPALCVLVCVPRMTDMQPSHGGWVRQALAARREAALAFAANASVARRFALFHPIGFPGRAIALRGSTVIVDDVYALTGSSHFRRRGLTFDGAVDLATLDRTLDQGYSQRIRAFRRRLMARRLGVAPPAGPATPLSAEWIRLERPRSAFALVQDMLDQGGLGVIQPLWEGPSDDSVLPQTAAVADPDGVDTGNFLPLFASLLGPDA